MKETRIEGVESLRILRARGNLQIIAGSEAVEIRSGTPPSINRAGAAVEVEFHSNAAVAVPAGVAVEVTHCSGNLDAQDLSAPLAIERVSGNFHARHLGAISVRDRISGSATMRQVGSVDGQRVAGLLSIDEARSVSFDSVGGDLRARTVEADVAVERVSGSALVERLGGAIRSRHVGGKLYAESVGEIAVESIGGKARASAVAGPIRAARVGGRLSVDGAGGDVAVERVGGHATVARCAGGVALAEVGGAAYLRGPYPAGKSWNVRSRGRAVLEIDPDSALSLVASSGSGDVRLFGVDGADLRWSDGSHAEGEIGSPADGAERTRMILEAGRGDVIIARPGARERDYCGRGFRHGRPFAGAFSELGDIIAEEFGGEVPRFVGAILGAAGEFASTTGARSGEFARDITDNLTRGIRDAMSEVRQALEEVETKVPQEIAARLAELGREIEEMVRRAAEDGRLRSHQARREMREKIRAAAHEMRETIREAAHQARQSSAERRNSAEDEDESRSGAEPSAGATRVLSPETAANDVMSILRAVREGKLEPEEADEMIAALMEVERAAGNGDPR